MTDFYLDSGGGAASSPFANWTDAAATLAAIIADGAYVGAGDRIFMEIGHNETSASNVTWNTSGTKANPLLIVSCTATDGSTGKNYTKATTAQLQRTGSGDVTFNGSTIFDGIFLEVGDDLGLADASDMYYFKNSTIELTGSGSVINAGNSSGGNQVILDDTELDYSNGGDGIIIFFAGDFLWMNGPNNNSKYSSTGVVASNFITLGSRENKVTLDGVDLSPITTNLISSGSSSANGTIKLRNCILGSGVTLSGSIGNQGITVQMIESDDTTSNDLYAAEFKDYYGSTVITDTDYLNASDGTNSVSWKMVSLTTGQEFYEGTKTPWITGWVDSTGSKTFTIELVTDNVTLQNDEIAMELEFLDASADVQTKTAEDKVADSIATPANITSSAQAWTSPNITTDLDQKLVITQTVNRVGPFRARVVLYGASTTVWVDPKITVA